MSPKTPGTDPKSKPDVVPDVADVSEAGEEDPLASIEPGSIPPDALRDSSKPAPASTSARPKKPSSPPKPKSR
jgi:hypothetical protein